MNKTTRRDFIKKAAFCSAAFLTGGIFLSDRYKNFSSGSLFSASAGYAGSAKAGIPQGKEALYYTFLQRNRVSCELCYHKCTISSGRRGFCRI